MSTFERNSSILGSTDIDPFQLGNPRVSTCSLATLATRTRAASRLSASTLPQLFSLQELAIFVDCCPERQSRHPTSERTGDTSSPPRVLTRHKHQFPITTSRLPKQHPRAHVLALLGEVEQPTTFRHRFSEHTATLSNSQHARHSEATLLPEIFSAPPELPAPFSQAFKLLLLAAGSHSTFSPRKQSCASGVLDEDYAKMMSTMVMSSRVDTKNRTTIVRLQVTGAKPRRFRDFANSVHEVGEASSRVQGGRTQANLLFFWRLRVCGLSCCGKHLLVERVPTWLK